MWIYTQLPQIINMTLRRQSLRSRAACPPADEKPQDIFVAVWAVVLFRLSPRILFISAFAFWYVFIPCLINRQRCQQQYKLHPRRYRSHRVSTSEFTVSGDQ